MKPEIPYPELSPEARQKLSEALQKEARHREPEWWEEALRRKQRHVQGPIEDRPIHEVVHNKELLG